MDLLGAIRDAFVIKHLTGVDLKRPSLTSVAANIGRKLMFAKTNQVTVDSSIMVVHPKYTSIHAVITAMTPRTEAVTKGIIKEGGATVIIAGVAVKIPLRGEVGSPMHSTVSAANSKVPVRKNAMKNFLDC